MAVFTASSARLLLICLFHRNCLMYQPNSSPRRLPLNHRREEIYKNEGETPLNLPEPSDISIKSMAQL